MRWLDAALVRRRLRACDSLGRGAVLRGTPTVHNTGKLVIGDDFWLNSIPVRSHLFVTGSMQIGNRVRIGAGATLTCLGAVDIADDVRVGDFVIILDSDFHNADDVSSEAIPRPIRIGEGVRIEHRVTILPGTTIGKGARLKVGSVVSGDVKENAVLQGNPARPVAVDEPAMDASSAEVPKLVMQVLGLPHLPDLHDGPTTIPQWDSLGALRLIVALEDLFGIALTEDEFKGARSVLDLMGNIDAAQRRKTLNEPLPDQSRLPG